MTCSNKCKESNGECVSHSLSSSLAKIRQYQEISHVVAFENLKISSVALKHFWVGQHCVE